MLQTPEERLHTLCEKYPEAAEQFKEQLTIAIGIGVRDDEQVPPEGGEFLVLHSTFFDLKIVDTTVNEEIQEVIRRANSYHERFGFEERKDLPHTQLGDLCILLIFLITRKFPLFEQIATNENVMGYLRNALDTFSP